MALTTTNAGALVPGISRKDDMKTLTVKVLRAFYYNGKVCEIGSVIELPKQFATELILVKRAVIADIPEEAPEEKQPERATPSKKKEVKTYEAE